MSENEFLNYFQELKLFENLMAPHLFRYGLLLFWPIFRWIACGFGSWNSEFW